MTDALTRAALDLAAQGYPVFPVGQSKRPAISRERAEALGLTVRGKAGLWMASLEEDKIRTMFAEPSAWGIGVPTGPEFSGLVAVDCDIREGQAEANREILDWLHEESTRAAFDQTLVHATQNGGLHFLFKLTHHLPEALPSLAGPKIDVKSSGGYVVFPPSPGYTVAQAADPVELSDRLIARIREGAQNARRGLANGTHVLDFEQAVASLQANVERHHALNSLAIAVINQRAEAGESLDIEDTKRAVAAVVKEVGAEHIDKRRLAELCSLRKGGELHRAVEGGMRRRSASNDEIMRKAEALQLREGEQAFMGPVPDPKDERAAVDATPPPAPESWMEMSVSEIRASRPPRMEWLVQDLIPKASICSLAGTSNVGKTRFLSVLAVALASGRIDLLGFAPSAPMNVAWVANEERGEDILRRLYAAADRHGLKGDGRIGVLGKDHGQLHLVVADARGNPVLNMPVIESLIEYLIRLEASVVFLDPMITLSSAGDENSARDVQSLHAAFSRVSEAAGVSIVYTHHVPKERSQDADWYGGSPSAWRGSGAIYGSLDVGWTLAPYIPTDPTKRKQWKLQTKDKMLDRYVMLESGKVREGAKVGPLVYHMQSHTMPAGDEIGVTCPSSREVAEGVLANEAVGTVVKLTLAELITKAMGKGRHALADLHRALKDNEAWPAHGLKTARKDIAEHLAEALGDTPIRTEYGTLLMSRNIGASRGQLYTFVVT